MLATMKENLDAFKLSDAEKKDKIEQKKPRFHII